MEDYTENIKKIQSSLAEEIDNYTRIRRVALLRYYLGKQEEEKTKVIYDKSNNELILSESLKMSEQLIKDIADELRYNGEKIGLDKMQELNKLMKDNFYYLSRYLFSYYLIAIEFGIPKEKQFYAPRDMVLGPIAKRLDVFYYKPRAVLALNMPQGTGKTEIGKRFMSWVIGKDPDLPNMMVSYSASIAKDKFYNGIMTLIDDENGNFQKIFPELQCIYKNAETMSLDYSNSGRSKPHSEYTLYCAGFDGGITGRTRAHNVLYLDDLVKNMEAANNKDVMDKMNEEFNATLRKRMQGNCRMLIIGTLFSINDPFTRIITYFKENAPDRIEIIRLPRIK